LTLANKRLTELGVYSGSSENIAIAREDIEKLPKLKFEGSIPFARSSLRSPSK
jgi:hypothetical protein